ncbi:MAG: ATP-dependent DNA helicase, partial [Chloroflexota bacterium]
AEERPDDLVSPLLRVLERLKQELIPLPRVAAWCARNPGAPEAARLAAAVRLFQEHGRQTRRQALLDFDDVLVEAVRLLESRPELRERYRERFPALMVDEYQDTNLAQERLVELLAPASGALCVVGDDDQSIYRFRGASRASMERFSATFPEAQTLTLGRNRRSSGRVVAAARALIENNPDRIPKPLSGSPTPGRAVEVLRCPDGAAAAAAVATAIAPLLAAGGGGGIAVLCRTNAIARPIVDALRAAGIPFRHYAGQGLYQLAEVRDVVAMLRCLANPDDLLALARVLTRPPLSADLEHALGALRDAVPAASSLAALARQHWASPVLLELLELAPLVARLGVDEIFFELMARTRYLERAVAPADQPRAAAALARFGELVDAYCARSNDHRLEAYLARLDLVLLSGLDEAIPAAEPGFLSATAAGVGAEVEVMTIHQAKGLEFDTVFVPALVEGRLPLYRRGEGFDLPAAVLEPGVRGREDQVAEERRLFYVAMTRARRRLVVSWAERYEGVRRWRASRFLAEAAVSGALRERVIETSPRAAASGPAAVPAPEGRSPAAEPVRLSFSAVSTYRECPRQHWYRYTVGLPAAPSAEAQHGSVVHAALMRGGHLRAAGEAVAAERLLGLLDEAWTEVTPVDPRRLPALRALGRTQLERFAAAGGLAGQPVMVERAFTTNVDGWRLSGIIDRIDPPNPPPSLKGGEAGSKVGGLRGQGRLGAWRIVDYKTGAPLPAARLRRDLQLALYALGARDALGLDPVDLEIVYLREDKRVVVPGDDELIAEASQVVGEVAAGIGAGNREPRPERRRCSLCPYRAVCESSLAL